MLRPFGRFPEAVLMDFKLLGAIEVATAGGALALGGPTPRAVLADLALHAGETVASSQLIDDLWGEQPPASAGQTLGTYIYRLRRVLDGSGAGGASLETRPTGYMLAVAPEQVDVWRFRDLAARGGAAIEQNDATTAVTLVTSALALWRGPALADVQAATFAPIAAQRLEEERLTAFQTLVDARLRLGQHRALVPELDAAIAGSPYRESFHAQLMLALYRSGRQAEALAAFRRARELLTGELGIEPGRELRELERAILLQAPELDLASGASQRALHFVAAAPPTTGPSERLPTAPDSPGHRPALVRERPHWRWAAAAAALSLAAAISLPILLAAASSHADALSDGVGELTAGGSGIVRSLAMSSPPGAAVSADGSVWVTNPERNVVYRIDLVNASIIQTIQVGSDPSAITALDGDIWVADTLDGTVSRINATVNQVVQRIKVGPGPTGIVTGGGLIWVADDSNSTLEAIDPVSGHRTRTIALTSAPFGVAFGAGSLWVTSPSDNSVTRIDPRSGQPGQQIPVGGSGPTAIVFGLGSVWVANGLDSTVSRVDPATDMVAATVPVGDGPDALAITGNSVWAANRLSSTLTRISADSDSRGSTLALAGGPVALTAFDGHVWVAAGPGNAEPTGGTVRLDISFPLPSIDASLIYPQLGAQFSEAAYDTLVTLQKTGGSTGLQLVPDLALALPTVSANGTLYTFTVRPGLRYSTGQPVRAQDFRYGIERALQLNASAAPFLDGIVGAAACTPGRHCDLARGVSVDDSAGTVTFHLTAPDPDFLYKLSFDFAVPVPADVPARDVGSDPVPATGPYMISRYVPGRTVVFTRNPYFREWSAAAQPAGSPDRIVWTFGESAARETTEIEDGKADWTNDTLPDTAELGARFPSQVQVHPQPTILYVAFNTRVAPFNHPRVRRAFSLAADRARLVALIGGADIATPSCQILPPGIPGYKPYCPFTADASASGAWVGPDLATARKLVAASGTSGMAVTVWSDGGSLDGITGAFTVSVLRELGYQAKLHTVSHAAVLAAVNDSRHRIQALAGEAWGADYASASDFFDLFFRCSDFRLDDPADTRNGAFFCDPAADRLMNKADNEQITNPVAAATTWTAVDRAVTYAAPWVVLANLNSVDFVSARVSNYVYNPFLGMLPDQLHVRE